MFPAYLQPLFHFSRKRTAFLWFSTKNTANTQKKRGLPSSPRPYFMERRRKSRLGLHFLLQRPDVLSQKPFHVQEPPTLLVFWKAHVPACFHQPQLYVPVGHVRVFFQKKGNGPGNDGVLMEVPLFMVYLSLRLAQLATLQPGATRSGLQTAAMVGPRPE